MGDQLREIRKRLGLSQAEFGRRLGAHGNSVARWERDEMRIPEPAARLACLLFVRAERERGGSSETAAERRALRLLERLIGKRALAWIDEASARPQRSPP